MFETSEISLALPADLVKKTAGLSIDIGGTMMKVVYRSKENLEEANATNAKIGHMQLVSFQKSDIHRALEYIKERCVISHAEGQLTEIKSTGIWFVHWRKTLRETLGVRLKNLAEHDCVYNSFTYLASRFSRRDFLHPYDDDAGVKQMETSKAMFEAINAFRCDDDYDASNWVGPSEDFFIAGMGKVMVEESDDPIAEVEEIYSCIVAMYGSGYGYMKIQKDKTFKMIDALTSGGSTLYGIGHLLTGCKSFAELIELAANGDRMNVDVYSDSLVVEKDEDEDASVYASLATSSVPVPMAYFGKADPTKPSLRREDVAAGWLHSFAMDTVHSLTLLAEIHHVKRIFITGSSCNSALMRSIFTTEMVRRNLYNSTLGISTVQFDFLKLSSYLSVLGALVSDCI